MSRRLLFSLFGDDCSFSHTKSRESEAQTQGCEARAARRHEAEIATAAAARAAAEYAAAESRRRARCSSASVAVECVGLLLLLPPWRGASLPRSAPPSPPSPPSLSKVVRTGVARCRAPPAAGLSLGVARRRRTLATPYTVAPRLRCRAGGCRALPGKGRRRPHMRRRARRESYYSTYDAPLLCRCSSIGGGA